MRKYALIIAILSLVAELILIAPSIAAHTLLALGFPAIASKIFSDPAWKGFALYTAGRWDEAAAIFAATGDDYNLGNALVHSGHYVEAITAYEGQLAKEADDEDAAFNKSLLEKALQQHSLVSKTNPSQMLMNSPATKMGTVRERPLTQSSLGGAGVGLASGSETQGKGSKGGSATRDGLSLSAASEDERNASATAAGSTESAGRKGEARPNFPDLLQERESRMRRRQQEAGVHPSPEWLQTLPDDPGQYLKLKILAEKSRRLNAAGGPLPEDD